MNKKQTENTVFDIILRDNVSRVEKFITLPYSVVFAH